MPRGPRPMKRFCYPVPPAPSILRRAPSRPRATREIFINHEIYFYRLLCLTHSVFSIEKLIDFRVQKKLLECRKAI
jgi:hypothetical protein